MTDNSKWAINSQERGNIEGRNSGVGGEHGIERGKKKKEERKSWGKWERKKEFGIHARFSANYEQSEIAAASLSITGPLTNR